MPYVFLIAAILLEAGGTYCMKLANGFTVLLPSIGCLGLYGLCFWSFSKALTGIPLSAAYATWGALGIVVATTISALIFKEALNAGMVIGIVLAVAGVIIVNMAAGQAS